MPGNSAARARVEKHHHRLESFRDLLCPGFPLEKLEVESLEAKRYFRDLCPGFPRQARARP